MDRLLLPSLKPHANLKLSTPPLLNPGHPTVHSTSLEVPAASAGATASCTLQDMVHVIFTTRHTIRNRGNGKQTTVYRFLTSGLARCITASIAIIAPTSEESIPERHSRKENQSDEQFPSFHFLPPFVLFLPASLHDLMIKLRKDAVPSYQQKLYASAHTILNCFSHRLSMIKPEQAGSSTIEF